MKIPCAITVDVEGDYWDENKTEGVIHGVPLILDLFNRLKIRGVFFWTAHAAQNHPDIVKKVINEGHEIGCHGLNHEDFSALSETQQVKVINRAARILRSFGADCKGFRAPRLRVNETLFRVLSDQGFSYDSSIPFWGIRRYKYKKRYDNPGPLELKCVPSYAFRLFYNQFPEIVTRSYNSLGYFVFFLHPWEVIQQSEKHRQLHVVKRLNVINTLKTGPLFLSRLESHLCDVKERFQFQRGTELSDIVRLNSRTQKVLNH